MTRKAIIFKGLVLLIGFLMISSFVKSSVLADWALLPRTGQTTSYATGDDGDLQMGVEWPNPRFTDNGDGTVTDNLTGLVWLQDANCFGDEEKWSQALNHCNYLAIGQCNLDDGSFYGDWRLPNRNEIESLFDISEFNVVLPSGNPFVDVKGGYENYWSSTTMAEATDRVWTVRMHEGTIGNSSKTNDLAVWCVRGTTGGPAPVPKTGQTTSYATGDDGDLEMGVAWPNPRFTDNGNGTVTDNLTGLIWLKNANCFGQETWSQALSNCNYLASGPCGLDDGSSFGDWRLPNKNEIESLFHLGVYDFALPDTAGTGQWSQGNPFNNVMASYVSSTTWANGTDNAWCASINYSTNGGTPKSNNNNMWCVRGGGEDSDADGIPDSLDNCPDDPNPNQEDLGDEDGVGDVCDNCPDDANLGQEDADTDTIGDVCDDCTDTDGDTYGNPGFPANTCPEDNCPDDANPGQEDTDSSGIGDICNDAFDADGDEWEDGLDNCPDDANPGQEDLDTDTVGDVCDNCYDIQNASEGGTCICGNEGVPCDSNDDCGDCGSCSMDQEDTDGDEIGDVCDSTPYANLCQSYCDKCNCCVDLRDVQGRNVDYDDCTSYTNSTDCTNANCFWNTQGLPAPGTCTVDVCRADADFSGRITGADLTKIKKDLGRVTCPCGPYSDDLCLKYLEKYQCCLDLSNVGSNLDYDDCAAYTDSTTCADNDCYWNSQGLPAPGVCTVDICLADNDFSSRITGTDLGVMKKELGRVSCPCNP